MGNVNNKIPIKCLCNTQIKAHDIVQLGVYLRVGGPSYVFIKFLCPQCQQYGEQLIEQAYWDKIFSKRIFTELTDKEMQKFEKMGRIESDELIDFHFSLKELRKF